MAVTIDIDYLGNLHCAATHGPSGSRLATDAPTDNGGLGELFSPTDLVATALGTCLTTVMGLLARRTGLDLEGTRVRVEERMISEPVRRSAHWSRSSPSRATSAPMTARAWSARPAPARCARACTLT